MSSCSLMHHVFPASKPPDGEHPQSFCLVIGGTQLCGSWHLSAIVRLQGFSSCSLAVPPRRWSPKTVTTSPMVGRSEPGCDLGPALSFKDLHHPRWGGGQAEPELYLPRGFVGQPLPQHSRERALTGLAGGADFDNAGPIDGGRRQLQRVGLAGLAPGAPSRRKGGCRAARTGGPPKTSRAARAAFVFWGCPAFALVRRLRAEVGALLVREDLSGDLPAGRRLLSSVPRWRRLEKSSSPARSPPPSKLGASGSLYLCSPLERRRRRGQGCSGVRPEAIAAAVWPPGAGVVVAAAGAGNGGPSVGLLLLRRPPNRVGLFVPVEVEPEFRLQWHLECRCLVHCGCRGLNMYVFSARSRVFSSFRALRLACRLSELLHQA
jgi:hypothetical protein